MTAALIDAPARVSLIKRQATSRSTRTIAWDDYYAHSSSCRDCARMLHNCPAGAALWGWYREVRGPVYDPRSLT